MYNPPSDGNCQFGALCFWLNRLGIHRSAETVREEIIKYLTNNPSNSEGMPLELFAATPWVEYLHSMAKNGTYGDQITLQVAADLYNIEIVVVSTLGPDATAVISPASSTPAARVQLEHYAENHGEHYICVDGRVLLEEEEQEKRWKMMSRREGHKKRWKMMARICYLLRRMTHMASIWERKERCLNKINTVYKYPSTLLETRPLKWFPRTTLPPP